MLTLKASSPLLQKHLAQQLVNVLDRVQGARELARKANPWTEAIIKHIEGNPDRTAQWHKECLVNDSDSCLVSPLFSINVATLAKEIVVDHRTGQILSPKNGPKGEVLSRVWTGEDLTGLPLPSSRTFGTLLADSLKASDPAQLLAADADWMEENIYCNTCIGYGKTYRSSAMFLGNGEIIVESIEPESSSITLCGVCGGSGLKREIETKVSYFDTKNAYEVGVASIDLVAGMATHEPLDVIDNQTQVEYISNDVLDGIDAVITDNMSLTD